MEFSPFNPIIRLCISGMELEANGQREEALKEFLTAWNGATNDHERFLGAYFVARVQNDATEKLQWLHSALDAALKDHSESVMSAYPGLYAKLADVYDELGNREQSTYYKNLSLEAQQNPTDKGPFYHGTRADLRPGDHLTPGGNSNYQSELMMNHIYFTSMPNGAGLAAALAKGDGKERVYMVQPTGPFENDPNLTDKKFPGNPTRSYRSSSPLKIIGELDTWQRASDKELDKFKGNLNKGEIIN
jgi:Rifampin ADP-ribosyl transferase